MDFVPKNEGIDHINIYSKSKLLLGRQLSNFYHSRFALETDGLFESVEGYWYWLSTGKKHDILRRLYGHEAKKVGESFKDHKVHVDNFNYFIIKALWAKIEQNIDIANSLQESELPLTHYYYFGEIDSPKIVNLPQYQWCVDAIEEIRIFLKESEILADFENYE